MLSALTLLSLLIHSPIPSCWPWRAATDTPVAVKHDLARRVLLHGFRLAVLQGRLVLEEAGRGFASLRCRPGAPPGRLRQGREGEAMTANEVAPRPRALLAVHG